MAHQEIGAETPSSTTTMPAEPSRPAWPFTSRRVPASTPWGPADHQRDYADGITFLSTASHGGFRVSPACMSQMHPALRECTSFDVAPDGVGWFEEDIAWCAVALAFPEHFPAEHLTSAESTLKDWRPDQWERLRGAKLPEAESSTLRERAFYKRHRADLLVVNAWGDWAPGVPSGKVGIYAIVGGGRSTPPAKGSYWLVDAAEYQSQRPIAFVIDPARHESCAGDFDQNRRARAP
jgi:hypothetical protein